MADHTSPETDGRGGDSTVVTLNAPTVELLGLDRARELAHGMAAIAQDRLPDAQVDERLHALLREVGLEQSEVVVSNLADRLYNATDVTVVTNDGTVLHGDPSWSAQTASTGVEGTEDPESRARPTYS